MEAPAQGTFWTRLESTETLCLFRILWGSIFLLRVATYGTVTFPFVVFKPHFYSSAKHYVMAGYHDPWLQHLPVPDYHAFCLLEDFTYLFAGLLVIGLATRLAAPVLFLLYLYQMSLSQLTYRHHLLCFLLVFGVLAISVCDEHYSVDAWLRRRRSTDGSPPLRLPAPRRLLQLLTTVAYVGSISTKLCSYYLSGAAIGHLLPQHWVFMSFRALHDVIAHHTALIAWCALGLEVTIVFGLWFTSLRGLAMLAGLLLHTSITLIMPVGTFSLEILTLYLAFLNPASHQVRAGLPAPWIRFGKALDWLFRVDWVVSETTAWADVNGQHVTGSDAWPQILLRLPLTFPAGMLWYGWSLLQPHPHSRTPPA